MEEHYLLPKVKERCIILTEEKAGEGHVRVRPAGDSLTEQTGSLGLVKRSRTDAKQLCGKRNSALLSITKDVTSCTRSLRTHYGWRQANEILA